MQYCDVVACGVRWNLDTFLSQNSEQFIASKQHHSLWWIWIDTQSKYCVQVAYSVKHRFSQPIYSIYLHLHRLFISPEWLPEKPSSRHYPSILQLCQYIFITWRNISSSSPKYIWCSYSSPLCQMVKYPLLGQTLQQKSWREHWVLYPWRKHGGYRLSEMDPGLR